MVFGLRFTWGISRFKPPIQNEINKISNIINNIDPNIDERIIIPFNSFVEYVDKIKIIEKTIINNKMYLLIDIPTSAEKNTLIETKNRKMNNKKETNDFSISQLKLNFFGEKTIVNKTKINDKTRKGVILNESVIPAPKFIRSAPMKPISAITIKFCVRLIMIKNVFCNFHGTFRLSSKQAS